MAAAVLDLERMLAEAWGKHASTRYSTALAKDTARRGLDTAGRLISALKLEGQANVLAGRMELSAWQSIANDAAEHIRAVLDFSAKWSAGAFFSGVAERFVEAVPELGKELSSLTRWVVVGLVAVAAIYLTGFGRQLVGAKS